MPVKHYSIALLVAGIGLIAGSCVPLAQTLWLDAGGGAGPRVSVPPLGGEASLDVSASRYAAPVIRVEAFPALAGNAPPVLRYSFSIAGDSGGTLVDESGTASLNSASAAGRAPALELRFDGIAIPAGQWTVRFDTGPARELIRSIELRLEPASTGTLAALMTALILAILGWLAASLGALYWIRAEAARPAGAVAEDASAAAGQERLWTVACHFSALLGYLLPFGHVIGPLAVWLAKRRTLPGIERAGREALNFQLSVTLYVLAALFLSFFLIGLVILFAVVVFHFATVLYASLRAQRGLDVRYPLVIKII